MSHLNHDDILTEKYIDNENLISLAHGILSQDDQIEDEFLGAQGILLLNGLL